MVKKNSSLEEQEVANLPDFVKIENREKKLSVDEMLNQIKRKEELSRINQKLANQNSASPSKLGKQPSVDVDAMLMMKTSDFMDEAERQLLA